MTDDLGFRPICHDCAPKPLGLTKEQIDPLTLINRYIKLGFDTGIPEGEGPTREHIWLRVYSLNPKDATKLFGIVVSNPVAIEVGEGDMIEFDLGDIEEYVPEEAP
jgi:hypothetical protein